MHNRLIIFTYNVKTVINTSYVLYSMPTKILKKYYCSVQPITHMNCTLLVHIYHFSEFDVTSTPECLVHVSALVYNSKHAKPKIIIAK